MSDWDCTHPWTWTTEKKSWSAAPDDGVRVSAEAGTVCIAIFDGAKNLVMNLRFDPATARDYATQLLAAADAAALMKSVKK